MIFPDLTGYSRTFNRVQSWIVPCLIAGLLITSANAQNPATDPAEAYNRAARAIDQKKWDAGLKAVNGILSTYPGNEGKKWFGPAFGHFYYLKGLLEIGKKQYPAAIKSFQTCYNNYPNVKVDTLNKDGNIKNQRPNIFRNASLVQWGNVEMHMKKYGEAARLYKKALAEGKDDVRVNRIYVTVNLGRCLIMSGQLDEGYKLLVPALKNEQAGKHLKQLVFMIIAEDWSPKKKFPEIRNFIDEYRYIVSLDFPEDRYDRNPRFQRLAQVAFEKDDPILALTWYSLMIDPIELVPDVDREIEELKAREVEEEMEEKKQEFISKKQKERAKYVSESSQLLNGAGAVHFLMQNFSGAFVVFAKLSDEVPKNYKDRAVYLHNAVVSAARIGKWKRAYHYGKIFLDDYPKHELMPSVARVLVELIYLDGKYQEAYDISGEVRVDMEPGSDIRDVPDFVYGASAFHLEKIPEAEVELDKYLADYPNGKRLEPVQFYAGLTKVRLFKWEEAANILNTFITSFPNSSMIPDALQQCALAEFMLDRFEPCLEKIERVISEFPNHQVIAKTWNLRGDVFATEEREFEEVIINYINGKKLADQMPEERETAAYSLWQLVIHYGEAKEWELANECIMEFRTQHATSVYRLEFLVASLPTLVALDRREEGLTLLRKVIFDYGDKPESTELAEFFGSYVDYLKNNFTPEEAMAEMEKQVENAYKIPALRGWLNVGMINLLGGEDKTGELEKKRNALYYRLGSEFDPAINSNYVTVQLARWIAGHRKKPIEARILYDYIIENRPGTSNYNYALVDTAELLAKSGLPDNRIEALARFERVLQEIPDEELRELAVLGIARVHTKDKNYAEAQPFWEQYLENREWTVSRPEANYEYARCMDEQGQTADALKIYVSVYANFPGHLDWSTRAYVRTAVLMKESGEDRKALLVLQDMLKRMGHHDHPVINQAKKTFVKWRDAYDPEKNQPAKTTTTADAK